MTRKSHPKAPEHLSDDSKRFWRWAVREFVLEPHSLQLLRLLCEHRDRCETARQALAASGDVFLDRFGQPRPHPMVAQYRDSTLAVARLTRELRLDNPAPEPRIPRR